MKRGRGEPRACGFTLPEVMLVLAIMVLAAILIFTLLGRDARHRNSDRFVADLEEFATAFQTYHRQNRTWPPSTSSEVATPPGMESFLEETNWDNGSPFGGSYGWDRRGAVVLTAFAPAFPLELTRADLLAIDDQIDDGDLTRGRFRTGFNGWPVYFVRETP